ncbi:hypothetical protein P3S67_031300 [Capsicum chacoense]
MFYHSLLKMKNGQQYNLIKEPGAGGGHGGHGNGHRAPGKKRMPRAPPVPEKPDLQLPNGPNPTTTTTTPQKKKFCISKLHVSESEMKANLNWACKYGRVDCRPINPGGGECFDNTTLTIMAWVVEMTRLIIFIKIRYVAWYNISQCN